MDVHMFIGYHWDILVTVADGCYYVQYTYTYIYIVYNILYPYLLLLRFYEYSIVYV